MSAEITPERIAELRWIAPNIGATIDWPIADHIAVLDALESSRAEADKAKRSLIGAGYTDCGGELWKPPLGPSATPLLDEIDRLRAEVQRLTAWVQKAGLPSIPIAMAPDGIASIRVENYKVERIGDKNLVWVDADEVRRLLPLTEEARSSDAGRVEVPELTEEEELAIVREFALKEEWPSDGVSEDFMDYIRWGLTIGMRYLASRLSPSPQPSADVVVVPWVSVEDRLPEDGQSVAFVTRCDRDPFYHGRVLGGRYSAGEFGGFSVPGLMSEASHWLPLPPSPDALRSSTNAQDAGEGIR